MSLDQDVKETEKDIDPETVVETTDNDDAVETGDAVATEAPTGWRQKLTSLWFPLALAVALIASAALAGWLYFAQYRADLQTGEAASAAVLKAANDGTVALLSYAPDSLDRDFSAAKTHLTGDFLSYYTQFTDEIVAPAAKEKSVKTTAAVVRSAVAEIHPDSAVVLVFVNQATTSQENPNGSFSASAVKVGMNKVDGNWLIGSFDPV